MLHENSFVVQGATIRNWYQAQDAFPLSETDSSLQIAFGIADLDDRQSTDKRVPENIGKLEAWYRTRVQNTDGSVTNFGY